MNKKAFGGISDKCTRDRRSQIQALLKALTMVQISWHKSWLPLSHFKYPVGACEP